MPGSPDERHPEAACGCGLEGWRGPALRTRPSRAASGNSSGPGQCWRSGSDLSGGQGKRSSDAFATLGSRARVRRARGWMDKCSRPRIAHPVVLENPSPARRRPPKSRATGNTQRRGDAWATIQQHRQRWIAQRAPRLGENARGRILHRDHRARHKRSTGARHCCARASHCNCTRGMDA